MWIPISLNQKKKIQLAWYHDLILGEIEINLIEIYSKDNSGKRLGLFIELKLNPFFFTLGKGNKEFEEAWNGSLGNIIKHRMTS